MNDDKESQANELKNLLVKEMEKSMKSLRWLSGMWVVAFLLLFWNFAVGMLVGLSMFIVSVVFIVRMNAYQARLRCPSCGGAISTEYVSGYRGSKLEWAMCSTCNVRVPTGRSDD